MAQIHSIDGTAINYVTHADWEQPVVDQSFNIIAVHQRVQRHTWLADTVPMSEWETLIGKRGSLVSLATTDPDDRNADYVTYYGVAVQAVEARGHEARNMVGVQVDFLVRV